MKELLPARFNGSISEFNNHSKKRTIADFWNSTMVKLGYRRVGKVFKATKAMLA